MKKIAFDPRTMDILKHYAKPAGIGAGIGALGMGASSLMSDDPEEHKPSGLMKSMLMGAGLGGAGGAGIRAGADILKPGQTSPEGLKAQGLPGHLDSSHWGLNLTRPFAGEDHGGSNWSSVPASAGVGAMAQIGANKMLPKPKDISGVKTPNLTWGGHNPADEYYKNVVRPKEQAVQTPNFTTPGKTGKGGGGASTIKHKELEEAMKAFDEQNLKAFEADRGAVSDLKDGKGLGRAGMEQMAGHSPRVGFDPNKNWNPALGPIDPANEQMHKMRGVLGAGGADVAGKMTALQKLRASIQNPLAWAAGQALPESHVYQGARDLPPTHIQPSELKGQTWTDEVYKPHPTSGKLNRYAYTPESAAVKANMTGKAPSMMGRGKWAVGPAAAAGAYFGGGALHDHAMDKAIQEIYNSGPQGQQALQSIMRELEASRQPQQAPQH